MSGEGQTRKRRDKKKRKAEYDLGRVEYMLKNIADNDDNLSSSTKEDIDDDDDDEEDVPKYDHTVQRGPNVGFLSGIVFILLLGGLVTLTALIFLELKDSSKEVETPIAESRYANILGDFVDERVHEEEDECAEMHHENDDNGHEDSAGEEHDHVYLPVERISDTEGDGGEVLEDGTDDTVDQMWQEKQATENIRPESPIPEEEVDFGGGGDDEVQPIAGDVDPVIADVESTVPSPVEEESIHQSVDSPMESAAAESDRAEPLLLDDQLTVSESEVVVGHPQDTDFTEELAPAEETQSGAATEEPPDPWTDYANADITNRYDFEFHEELDEADEHIEKSPEKAKQKFEEILRQHAASPRALYGKARTLDRLSETRRSNALLEQSITAYQSVLGTPDVSDGLFRVVAERCVDRMRFRGFIGKAVGIQKMLVHRFPSEATYRNQLAVSYLLLGQNKAARQMLGEVLDLFPNDGFAKVHYGFILKTAERNYLEAIRYLREGIATGEPGTVDGRFYFQLGDALTRVGFPREAQKVYEDGVAKGLFLSAYQRSLYNVDSLTGRPWWSAEETTYKRHLDFLETRWKIIRDEGIALLNEKKEGFVMESEGLRDTGDWKQFELFARGKKMQQNCAKTPKTCELVENIPDAANCNRGQVKFSIMHPKTHVWAHTGPTNCRIRAHLGLVVPTGVRIRVANETRQWIEGQFIIFDDSFEHEVWHEGDTFRLVLIVDFWHPELTAYQKRTLSPI